jgi:thermitase
MPLSESFYVFHVSRWSGRALSIGRGWDLAAKLATDRDVACAEPAFRCQGLEPDPEKPLASYEAQATSLLPGEQPLPCARNNPVWSIELAGIDQAWKLPLPAHGKGKRYGKGIVVAHPDTGYTRHDEIWNQRPRKRRILASKGYDYEDDDPDAIDPLDGPFPSHGTSTASVIMSDHNPSAGSTWVSGAAPKSKLIPFRVSDSVIHFDFTNVALAIHQAVDGKAHVISMSLGGPFPSRFLERAIDRAINHGLIVLAAAGNSWPWVVYPARYRQVLAIAAHNCKKKPWSKSARGGTVDISAPGESVWRAETLKEKTDPYLVRMGSGTSYAVATAAGACALWLAYHSRKRLEKRYGAANLASVFREILITEGFEKPPGWDKEKYGVGILRADRLLKADLPKTAPAAGPEPMALRMPQAAPTYRQQIAEYFPSADRPHMRTVLAQFLGVDPEEVDGLLEVHGDELSFHVATNPDFRTAIHTGARPRALLAAAPLREISRDSLLKDNVSRLLRKRLGLK